MYSFILNDVKEPAAEATDSQTRWIWFACAFCPDPAGPAGAARTLACELPLINAAWHFFGAQSTRHLFTGKRDEARHRITTVRRGAMGIGPGQFV